MARSKGLLLLIAAGVSLGACASYDDRLREAHEDYYNGQPGLAIDKLQAQLEGDGPDRLPLLMELASALAADGRFLEAAQRLQEVDEELEVLDYSTDTLSDIIAFTYSGETGDYMASPPERVMVNTQNILNYLAAGDLDGAMVEARRIQIFLTRTGIDESERFANRFAWGLAGFVLELGGDERSDDCWLEVPGSPMRPPGASPAGEVGASEERAVILVVAQRGKTPLRREASYLLPVSGRIHRLLVPTLVDRPATFTSARVSLDDGAPSPMPTLLDFGQHVRRRFDQEFPRLVAAAAAQAAGRALTAEGLRAGVQGSGGDEATGDLLATVFEWLLSTTTPADTRSWTLLPDQIDALRLDVPPGQHRVKIHLSGRSHRSFEQTFDLGPGEWGVMNIWSAIHAGYTPPPSPRQRDLANTDEGNAALRELERALHLHQVFIN